MTADQMLQELGYKKFTDMSGTCYESADGAYNITFYDEGKESVRINGQGGFTFGEIKAIAKLLEEMEGEENG